MKKLCVLLCLFLLLPRISAQLKKTADLLNNMRAIHIGGNWGRNPTGILQQPEDYYQFLRTLNINWAAINIGLHVSNSMDATVEKVYDNVAIPTFRDAPLRDAIRGFANHNINVMLTIAIETQEAALSNMPVNRWQFGDPNMPANDPSIKPENWPWATNHPQHNQFIQSWWQSYTKEVVYFAKIAEQEGVKMFAVGAETDRLFRTRSGGAFTNQFNDYIKALVDSVKKYFSGLITYELHWSALTDPAFYGPGSDNLWSDVGFDVVGVSSYFKLVQQQPNRVLGVDELEASWNNVFSNNLIPLQNRNPGKKIVFLEFGYNDALHSPFYAIADEFTQKVFTDANGNGKDDGEEQQHNILEAFYRVNENRNRVVSGTFLWDNYISSNIDWANSFGTMRMCSIRNKLAQASVALWYNTYTPLPSIPVLGSPANGAQNIQLNTELKWHHATDATLYDIIVSDNFNFSTLQFNSQNVFQTKVALTGLQSSKTYYWKVRSKNSKGESPWSQVFSFSTIALPSIPVLEFPANNAQDILTTVELRWLNSSAATSYDVQVAENSAFFPIFLITTDVTETKLQISNLKNAQIYFWRALSKNANGTSAWSQAYSFTTFALPSIPILDYPINGATNIPVNVELRWLASQNANSYDIQLAENQSFNPIKTSFHSIAMMKVQLTSLLNFQDYFWRVKAKNNFSESGWSQIFSFKTAPTVDVDEEKIPTATNLHQNFPNPFNPTTIIRYEIHKAGYVLLKIYDLLGREVISLVDEYKQPGIYNCELRMDNGELSSGIYIYALQADGFFQSKKMLLAK